MCVSKRPARKEAGTRNQAETRHMGALGGRLQGIDHTENGLPGGNIMPGCPGVLSAGAQCKIHPTDRHASADRHISRPAIAAGHPTIEDTREIGAVSSNAPNSSNPYAPPTANVGDVALEPVTRAERMVRLGAAVVDWLVFVVVALPIFVAMGFSMGASLAAENPQPEIGAGFVIASALTGILS